MNRRRKWIDLRCPKCRAISFGPKDATCDLGHKRCKMLDARTTVAPPLRASKREKRKAASVQRNQERKGGSVA